MAIKKGVNHSNNKERCSAGNLDDLLWKYCKLRYTNLSCSDVHWNFWRMCNALRLGSEVCDWYRLLHRFGEEGAQVFKKSLQFLFCILLPALSLQSAVCSLHFTLSLQFTPGPQSAVCVLEKPRSREPSQPALSYEHIENFTKDLEVRRDLGNRASPVNRAHMKRPLHWPVYNMAPRQMARGDCRSGPKFVPAKIHFVSAGRTKTNVFPTNPGGGWELSLGVNLKGL